MSGVFTLPPSVSFLRTLARGLLHRANGNSLVLSDIKIYLPTRRACRALKDAFAAEATAGATLLPSMIPLGDAGDEEDPFSFHDNQQNGEDDGPPAITPLRRQMLLTAMIMRKDPSLPLGLALDSAVALASLLDEAQIAQGDLRRLKKLEPSVSHHWQEVLTFLDIVIEAWPKVLETEGVCDPAVRHAHVLERLARTWSLTPPSAPILVAGSTGSIPAVGLLMKTVASLPYGEVILPGLDLSLDPDTWEALDDSHPQFTMKLWLEQTGKTRGDVKIWDDGDNPPPAMARMRLLQEAMRPAKTTQAWRTLSAQDVPPEALEGFEALTLSGAREEADVIALRLRGALEDGEKTAALITPDRALATRVAETLKRWNIIINDSAGTPLDSCPLGLFFLQSLRAADEEADPVDLLSLLKHPFSALGLKPQEHRAWTQEAEIRLWRGLCRADLFGGKETLSPSCAAWLTRFETLLAPLRGTWKTPQPLSLWLEAHLALVHALAQSDVEDGKARLWQGPEGEALALLLDDWRQAGRDLAPLTGEAYKALLEALLRQTTWRRPYGGHPRLHILGPLESRLMTFDLVVLGGLNEGVWPRPAPFDPWLSRPMKKQAGLTLPERRIGLSAHDFTQLACAPHVLMTRARRAGGTPTVPSRFWLQIEAVLQATGHDMNALSPAAPWALWAKERERPRTFQGPCAPPAPCPPLTARPKTLSITDIGTWQANPYALYARRILNLRKLETLDADPALADFGTLIHAIIEACGKNNALTLPRLLEEGRKAFAFYQDRPKVAAFWWPKFERMALWLAENEVLRHAEGIKPLGFEIKGEYRFAQGALTVKGKADRLDLLPDGSGEVIDYKTGTPPTEAHVRAGHAPQLALLALMAQAGAMEQQSPLTISRLSYWKLRGQDGAGGKTIVFSDEVASLCEKAREGLERLINTFSNPATPYHAMPDPLLAPRHDDYGHLARIEEWRGQRDEGEDT